ncbi:MAG: hypothetical protein WC729_29915 [Sphingomonas sp.]|jgi:hypothetical protein|uniref:hypothetical protein n=1 Tax=Sphingomonas sp. TaxID=28214 RepID=UPI0035680439
MPNPEMIDVTPYMLKPPEDAARMKQAERRVESAQMHMADVGRDYVNALKRGDAHERQAVIYEMIAAEQEWSAASEALLRIASGR